jgi:tetratricopeptide (TPR) repeat protein
LAAVVVVGLVLVYAFTSRDDRYRGVPKRALNYLQEGDALLEKDSLDAALEAYYRAMDLEPTLGEIPAKMAEAYYRAGMIHKSRRNEQLKQAMFDQATQFAHDALQRNLGEGRAYYVLGALQMDKTHLDSAFFFLALADSLGLHTFDFHTLAGYVYNEREMVAKTLEHYLKAYELRPEDPRTLYNIGEIYFRVGNYSQSLRYFSELVKVEPKDPGNQANYAAALWKNGDIDHAKDVINEILQSKTARDFQRYNAVAWVLIDKELDPAWGVRLAQAAEAMKPDNIESLDVLGWGYYVTGDYAHAVEYLNKSMRKRPSPEVRRRLKMAKEKLDANTNP